ncbi:hypothetical protein T12_14682 [Trichinella patagoniensis]|uniref:Uncharacterized protein n=1 Tax=Trichinella patagoniensis TaxID=990121 RepID=A0A0V0ZR55_9BILA|nr:hypothetical protein T12_14682 [Trichinella patagoniensis]
MKVICKGNRFMLTLKDQSNNGIFTHSNSVLHAWKAVSYFQPLTFYKLIDSYCVFVEKLFKCAK